MIRSTFFRRFSVLALLVLTISLLPSELVAQGTELGRQRLGRSYWHLFAAYLIVWALVFGWVISIARRLRGIEDRLHADPAPDPGQAKD